MSKWTLALALCLPLYAQDAREIVEESQKRHRSESQRYEGMLRVYNPGGRNSEKRWIYQRKGNYGESKAILRFVEPPEVKGVALLILNHTDRASDQWMWLPELQRDRRVALQDRSTRFFGTDFSYEDLEERDVNQNDYRLLGEETIRGQLCWKIESRPRKSKSSQYEKVITWMRKDIYFPVQLQMYQKNELVRHLEYRRIEQVQGVWTALEMEMKDVKRNGRTVLNTDRMQYNLPLGDELFTLQALRRGM